MGLTDILKFSDKEICCIVGGGGKTSLLYALAGEMGERKALFTTTTKMHHPEEADHPFHSLYLGDLDELPFQAARRPLYAAQKILTEGGARKVKGYEPDKIARWISRIRPDLLIAEADGAAGKPVKFPAEQEPQLIPGTTRIIGIIGLDILNQPMSGRNFHRFQIAREPLSVIENELATLTILQRLVEHPRGLFKGASQNMMKTLVLNKADRFAHDQQALEEIYQKMRKNCRIPDQILLTSLQDFTNPIILK